MPKPAYHTEDFEAVFYWILMKTKKQKTLQKSTVYSIYEAEGEGIEATL